MQVKRATALGMCFGVRDALAVAFGRDDAADVTIYGELVHNETVLDRLRDHGFQTVPEVGRETMVTTDKVLITAHGVSLRERQQLAEAGKESIDTTCPLVQKVHNAALRLQEAGYFPVVIGKHGHVEVRGVTGDLVDYAVVATVAEGAALRIDSTKIGVVCQTTFAEDLAEDIVAALRAGHPRAEVRFHNTVCEPTRQRRAAVAELLPEVDAVVVVGGANSNNTRQLVSVCREGGIPAFQVQDESDLDPAWFEHCAVVGLTAGTSTLDPVVDAVEAALRRIPVGAPAAGAS